MFSQTFSKYISSNQSINLWKSSFEFLFQRSFSSFIQHKNINSQKNEPINLHQWKTPNGFDTGFKVSNSYRCLGKKKDKKLVPLVVSDPSRISWYSCGPTVYDSCHIGHASSFIRSDVIRRILMKFYEFDIFMVMGVTNVDDKIITRSNLIEVSFNDLIRKYEQEFFTDLNSLNILSPNVFACVDDVLPEIISFINKLIKKGHAYTTVDGNVWFDHHCLPTNSAYLAPSYEVWEQSDTSANKKSPKDFSLWKAVKPGELYWEAPWGNGRPGWHIECSTLSSLYFNDKLDVHTGAVDLKFPHHECEIFQCHSFHETDQWCNYFLHTGHLVQPRRGGKMSKSLGNVVTIQSFLQSHSADLIRLICIETIWHDDIFYHQKTLTQAQTRLNKLAEFAYRCQQYIQGNMSGRIEPEKVQLQLSTCKAEVDFAFKNDFDTPKALESVYQLCLFVNQMLGDNILMEEWKEPVDNRHNDCIVEILHFFNTFFGNLGFTEVFAHNFKRNRT